jgi:hypothetical protein
MKIASLAKVSVKPIRAERGISHEDFRAEMAE